jgi:DNA-binding response OmpR family regulator
MNTNQKRILVVDDNAVIVRTLSMKLESAGFTVFKALDGSEAVSLARREKPDLIVLDICFPPDVAHGGGIAWDGFLIIDWLHRMDEAKDTPIIVISGGDRTKYEERSLKAGAIAYFQKPVDNEELVATVRAALEPVA